MPKVTLVIAFAALVASIFAIADWPNPPGRDRWTAIGLFFIIVAYLLLGVVK